MKTIEIKVKKAVAEARKRFLEERTRINNENYDNTPTCSSFIGEESLFDKWHRENREAREEIIALNAEIQVYVEALENLNPNNQ